MEQINNENLIKLRELRDEEKALKRVINDTKDAAITEAFEYAPEGGTFTIEGVGKYTLKLNPTIDLKDEKGKFARAWQKKQLEYNDLQEKIDALKRKQSDIQEDMGRLAEKHIASTATTDHPYVPQLKPSISVL